jgi:tRNA A37 threonylcarbamoyladenosine modification protein TsaB
MRVLDVAFVGVSYPGCVVGVLSAKTIARAPPDPVIGFALEVAYIQLRKPPTDPSMSCLDQRMNQRKMGVFSRQFEIR